MKDYFDSIREYLRHEITLNAMGYLRNGLDLLHAARRSTYTSIAPAVGNLGVAVELMLKAMIVSKGPSLLFKHDNGFPPELRALLTAPDAMPAGFNRRPYDIKLRSFSPKYKTIQLGECIQMFYAFYPQHRQTLQPYFEFLSACRNPSIHAALPLFQRYDLERTAFLALRVLAILSTAQVFRPHESCLLQPEDERFLSEFDAERAKRVREDIERAKSRAEELTRTPVLVRVDDWDTYVTRCFICASDATLRGYTAESVELDEDGLGSLGLEFFASSFECSACQLALHDVEGLRLASMETRYDRSDELDQWLRDTAAD